MFEPNSYQGSASVIYMPNFENVDPVGIFGWDIVRGVKYVALIALIRTVIDSILEACRILYAWYWVQIYPVIPINERLVKVVQPHGFADLVIGERLKVLGHYNFNPTCILVSLVSAILIEYVWYLGVIAECREVCLVWFFVMALCIAFEIFEDRALPGPLEWFMAYQMWVMVKYMGHLARSPEDLETRGPPQLGVSKFSYSCLLFASCF